MKSAGIFLCLCLASMGLGAVAAQSPATTDDGREADRQALRALAARYEAAIGSGDLMSLQDSVLPGTSAVFMTGDEVTGLANMQTFLDGIKKQLGAGTKYSVKLNPNPTQFEGDLAMASGTSDEKVVFGNGKELNYQTKWTAILKKVDGKWFSARLHVSLDPINNPIIEMRTRMEKWTAVGIALAGGVFVGILLVVIRKKRQS
jgi:ketosteroid isomerase-like protein